MKRDIQIARNNVRYWRSRLDLLKVRDGSPYFNNIYRAEAVIRKLESGQWVWLRRRDYAPRLVEVQS